MIDTRLPLAERVVCLAASAVGMKERGGANHGPPVEMFAGDRKEPWCAHFIAYLFREEGRPLPGDIEPSPGQHNPIAKVSRMWDLLVEAQWEVPLPKRGDIVVFCSRMDSDTGHGWHVELVTVVEKDGKSFQTIGGNIGDAVKRQRHHVDDGRIVGFARVPEPVSR